MFFLGRPKPIPNITYYFKLGFQLVLGLTPNNAVTWFCQTPACCSVAQVSSRTMWHEDSCIRPQLCSRANAYRCCQAEAQNEYTCCWRRFGKSFTAATNILSPAAHSTNTCSFQMWHHLKGKRTDFPTTWLMPRSISTNV